MTFSLEGKAGLKIHKIENGVETVSEGLFNMNTETRTMSAIDIDFHHGAWADGKSVDFRNDFKVLVLTENQLMIGNYRDEALSGEGKCVFCWNFVSKDYADNYVPEIKEDPIPQLPDNWMNDLSEVVTSKLIWNLSQDSPFDWFELDGTRKNGYVSYVDYPSIHKPVADLSGISLAMRSNTNDYIFTMPGFDDIEGKYSVTNDGIYEFSEGLSSKLIGGTSIKFETDNNKLRVLNIDKDASGVTGMWLGIPVYDNQGRAYQYLGYHFILQQDVPKEVTYSGNLAYFNTGWSFFNSDEVIISKEGNYSFSINVSDDAPYGIYLDIVGLLKDHPNADVVITKIDVDGNELSFDDEIINRGVGDDATIYRRYILNPWAQVVAFPDPNVFAVTSSITISVTVSYNDDLVEE